MSRIVRGSASLAALLAVGGALAYLYLSIPDVLAGVVGGPHDLSKTNSIYSTSPIGLSGACSACHVPHGAQDNILWARVLYDYKNKLTLRDGSTSSEPNYLLPRYVTTGSEGSPATLACYDCHDFHGGGAIETPSAPALNLFLTDASGYSHKPQDILFGFKKNTLGSMSEFNYGSGALRPGKTTPGYYENNPPSDNNYGVWDPPPSQDQTGGHYFKNDPKGLSSSRPNAGDKIPCRDCHDPHAWDNTGKWQAFIRKDWPTAAVGNRLKWGTTIVQGSSFMANPTIPSNLGYGQRNDAQSRQICIACHGDSDATTAVNYTDIRSGSDPLTPYDNSSQIVGMRSSRALTIGEHKSTSAVACISCHAHNSIGSSCSQCHGYPPSDTANPRYPATLTSRFVPVPDPGANDSHPRHVGNKDGQNPNSFSNYSFGCGACHYGSATGIDSSLGHHQNDYVSVVLQGIYTKAGSGYDNTNYYNPTYGTSYSGQLDNLNHAGGWKPTADNAGWNLCRNVYCHSAGRTQSSMPADCTVLYRLVNWNSGQQHCNDCHGYGTTTSPQPNGSYDYGMPSYANGGAGLDNANSHSIHVVAGKIECYVCHATTMDNAVSGPNRAIRGGTPTPHVNRAREVVFGSGASGSYDNTPGVKSCNVSCHGSDNPRWGATLTFGCFSCHWSTGASEQIYKPRLDYGTAGAPNPVDNVEYLTKGHGLRSSNYADNNLPAGFDNYAAATPACYVCHSQAAGHLTKSSSDPFRLGISADNTLGGIGTYTGRWADNTDALCLGCHGSAAQRAGHDGPTDNAAKGTRAQDMAAHARGITGIKYNWPGPNYPWKCIDCHDPHGDANWAMVRSGINAPIDNTDTLAGSSSLSVTRRTDGSVLAVTFTSQAGFGPGSYARSGNPSGPYGPCEVCHTQTNAYSRTLDNTATHASRTGRCTTCHPHNAGFAAKACKGCHGGDNGDPGQVSNNAPNITKYWLTSGHGMTSSPIINLQCEVCHDVSYLSGAAHKTDGSAGLTDPPTNTNTEMWPTKAAPNDNTNPNANTSHLTSSYFPAGAPTYKYEYALAFDKMCGDPRTGCHPAFAHAHKIHPNVPPGSTDPADNVLAFDNAGLLTPANPKLYYWYPAIVNANDYTARFYESRSPWVIGDLTTLADNASLRLSGNHYGTCVSCHDPHGTNVPANVTGHSTNLMLRGNSKSQGQFCNYVCHTSRTPP